MNCFGGIVYQICHGTGVERERESTHTHTHKHTHTRIFHGSISVLQRQWAVEQVIYSKSLSSVVIISKGFPCLSKITEVHQCLTLRLVMSYIYMEHPFLTFLDHTQRRTTVGRTPLDE